MQRRTAMMIFFIIFLLPIVSFAAEQHTTSVQGSGQAKVAELTLKGKKIVVDPGHGGSDPGAIGKSGLAEKDVTLAISVELQKLLQEQKAKVMLTRNSDRDVHSEHASDVQELQSRVDVANKVGADLFVSVHIDSFADRTARGTTTYFLPKSDRDALLAAKVQKALVSQIGLFNRGIHENNFYVLNHTTMPAVLIEVGFISNAAEEALLQRPDYIKSVAYGIYSGIVSFFSTVRL